MKTRTHSYRRGPISLAVLFLGSFLAACSSTLGGRGEKDAAPSSGGLSGAEIWANNCSRCHNFRDPSSLSDAQWDVAMMHMRVRAKLNGADAKAVLKFLQASN